MQSPYRTGWRFFAFSLMSAAAAAVGGCSAGSSGSPPDVDSQAASAYAMKHYDANGDGALEPSELSSCPALAEARLTFDTNGDDRLSANEVADGVSHMFASQRLTEMACTVTLNGRQLAGATVRLRPIEMLGDALPPAEGETNQQGTARPTINAELLPEEFRERPLVNAGLYRVEITHPRTLLASRYNTATELGCYVDPATSDGTSARFNLKLK
jgi:hypothetical protein